MHTVYASPPSEHRVRCGVSVCSGIRPCALHCSTWAPFTSEFWEWEMFIVCYIEWSRVEVLYRVERRRLPKGGL